MVGRARAVTPYELRTRRRKLFREVHRNLDRALMERDYDFGIQAVLDELESIAWLLGER